MTQEIRFPVSKEIKERHEKLVSLLGRPTQQLALALYISSLEHMEKEILNNKFPMLIPAKEKGVLNIKFVEEDKP